MPSMLITPYQKAVAITPHDTNLIPVTRALYVGVAGDVNCRLQDGTTVVFKAAPVGVLAVSVDRVLSTSTTATDMLALY